ncbi:hypothetical protein [Paenibacillus apiarius]|uniref:Uncharacterized protein n=1 Tax=Paenibacillus apiarius TaxID=46240 RepID=A0ABT4DQR6_9BACL|nr:hypothetical protein [Paenibacillus apiarius]MCY9513334.1 hypothetical protein [Paenibacillus apiarius]MCY9519694.1 hypothetical protein [Paenibacillus apiarius]MCY9553250.1 hypothetical protein [Paenibacillus apiarius]MCY9557100.1 hypothetical protein [Paenibacillus apiarius]MCY9682159.1 hypothetical protein [Paenibacillus apiarius]
MTTIINRVKYTYTFTPAFGPKILSHVNIGGGVWVNDTETNLAAPLESFEEFERIAKEIDDIYN